VSGKVPTWVWVVAAIAIVGVLGLVAAVGAGFYFVSRHMDTQAVTPADAVVAFEAERARFEGQRPLVELDSQGRFVRARADEPMPEAAERPGHLHLLAYDPADGRIVRFRLPFWLLRTRAGRGTVDIDGTRIDLQELNLTVEDLERYGPALLVDHEAPDGQRVLVWSQ
jgi:hypothetical protein